MTLNERWRAVLSIPGPIVEFVARMLELQHHEARTILENTFRDIGKQTFTKHDIRLLPEYDMIFIVYLVAAISL